jgi:DNA-binding beta-propeller fold protein YncE
MASVLLVLAFGGSSAWADDSYSQIDTVRVPDVVSFDISWVDPTTHTYYFANRGSGPGHGRIEVIDALSHAYLGAIECCVGFRGTTSVSGPNGIVIVPENNEIWAGDGDSSVKVINLSTHAVTSISIPGGKKRADELAYDPDHHLIMVDNNADNPAFATFISTQTYQPVGRIDFPTATDGVEQPVYDPHSGLFYQAVPETVENPGGEIDAIDPESMQLVDVFPVDDCKPHGLIQGPHRHLLLGCSTQNTVVMDPRQGRIVARITEVGGSDQVWYNPTENRYYLAANNHRDANGNLAPVLGVIDAKHNRWITNVPTAVGAHSVAVDPTNNHIFLPVAREGVRVYAASDA